MSMFPDSPLIDQFRFHGKQFAWSYQESQKDLGEYDHPSLFEILPDLKNH